MSAGRVVRRCEETLEGDFPPEVIAGWWVGRRAEGGYDQALAARIAWETLATEGIIDLAWVDDPARAFARDARDDVPCPTCGRQRDSGCCVTLHRRGTPFTLVDCLTFALNAEGMMAAEAIARQWLPEQAAVALWQSLDAREAVFVRERMLAAYATLDPHPRALLDTGYGYFYEETVFMLRAARR